MHLSIAHIVNPVQVPPSSDLSVAQPITFESMRRARETARESLDVALLSAQYPEDAEMVPAGFARTSDLDRSVLDLHPFTKRKKLPLLRDILDRLFDASASAEFLVFTNVDIGLQPHFYLEVERLASSGLQAFVINRRTLSDRYATVNQLPEMYADRGESHPGYDCFVFRRDLYPKLALTNVCVGATSVGRVLLWSLAAHAERFALFRDAFLTFHIGNRRQWLARSDREYRDYNRGEAATFIRHLEAARGPCYENATLWPYMWDRYETLGFTLPLWLRAGTRLKRARQMVRHRLK